KQLSEGLHGYISMNLPKQKEGFGYGVSFYVCAWPLLERPLSGFQIGLPGTWIEPDNRGFEEPLCPIGTYARDNWPQRGPSYRDVFQTIEGSLGFWGSTQFGSATAKYRMNGTPNCYDGEISSPGWGFGQTKPLKDGQMGMAQLGNHILVPPDGITFMKGTSGELMGNAWMALPLIPVLPKTEGKAPSADNSWTCFLNAANFKGPVAFYIPRVWSRIADNYPTAEGRTLDSREGVVGSGAIEINTVPRFEAVDSKGVVYTKIPRLQFPVNENGVTILMQDATLYSSDAIYQPLKKSFDGGKNIPNNFQKDASYIPECTTRPTTYDQGPKATKISGVEAYFQETMLDKSSYGLKWKKESKKGMGYFPEYFKKEGDKMVAVSKADVPKETYLQEQSFAPAERGKAYTSPIEKGTVWNSPGAKAGPFKATLSDGSVVTYYWYKFIDQPSLQSLNLSDAEKKAIQKRVEMIHANWTSDKEYMAPPSQGKLVTIDKAMIVNPPKGLEIGYVPIVTRQEQGK
ncbi:MAG: hypothetical protein M3Z56_07180, partial [Bacteroidota bacterium]|nr:hypothetical protein [Bacteroidota bacterium]